MARPPHDAQGAADRARDVLRTATDADELRAAQATLLPLLGLSLEQTAEILGRDRWWVSRARNRFLRGELPPKHGGRRRSLVSSDEELVLVKEAIKETNVPWYTKDTVRKVLRKQLDKRSSSTVSDSTISELLDRVAPRFIAGARGPELLRMQFHLARIWQAEEEIAARAAKQDS